MSTAYKVAHRIMMDMADSGNAKADWIFKAIGPRTSIYDRVMMFHRFYKAPIRQEPPDQHFTHMDNERVAFRLQFLVSELRELFQDGFGVQFQCSFKVGDEVFSGINDQTECPAIKEALDMAGIERRNIYQIADALGDINVVNNGFGIEIGLDMHKVDQEISASNFTKPDENGNPIIGDGTNGPVGKVLKGPNYVEPVMQAVIQLSVGE